MKLVGGRPCPHASFAATASASAARKRERASPQSAVTSPIVSALLLGASARNAFAADTALTRARKLSIACACSARMYPTPYTASSPRKKRGSRRRI